MSAHAEGIAGAAAGTLPRWRRYVFAFGGLVISLVGAVAAFNYLIDPLGIWRVVAIDGVNAAKSERRDHVYIFKAMDMQRLKPRVLLLGSSRAAYGLNPAHPLFEAGEAYNLSIPGGHLPVIVAYLEHALANNEQVETVVLGVDLFSFNENLPTPRSFEPRRLGRGTVWAEDAAATLITRDALRSSIQTVLSNVNDPGYQPYFDSGQLTAMSMRRRVERDGMVPRFDRSMDLYLNGKTRYGDFSLDADAFAHIERISALCAERGIALQMFVPPVHAVLREAIALRGHDKTYRSWLGRLVAIAPFWDFSGYNEITTEPIRFTMDNYWDVSHFRSEVGDLMLATMLTGAAALPGFGRYVTAETVDVHLSAL